MSSLDATDALLERLWPLYFDGEPSYPRSGDRASWAHDVRTIARAFRGTDDQLLKGSLKKTDTDKVVFSYPVLERCLKEYHGSLENFVRIIPFNPELAFRMLGCAVDLSRERELSKQSGKDSKTRIKFHSLPLTPLDSVSSNFTHHLVSLRGRVLKASVPKLMATSGVFNCGKCGLEQTVSFVNGVFMRPTRCDGKSEKGGNCRSRTFALKMRRNGGGTEEKNSSYADHQTITLQSTSDLGCVTGSPATVQVEVEGEEIVGVVGAGEDVEITGVVSSMNEQHAKGRGGKMAGKHSLHTIFVRANNIMLLGANSRKAKEDDQDIRKGYTDEQLRNIRQIWKADPGPNKEEEQENGPLYWTRIRNAFPFDLLCASLAPNIYGHEVIKAGLVLVLLGGSETDDGGVLSGVSTRYNPHMLIVGDPGMGKSMLLTRTVEIAERSIYIGGNTTTSTGLTVSVVKDGSDTTLEAGALVLADKGICCLDEFDKMDRAENALLECMEQQSISVAKSGICTTLPARCSVIAAANPKSGRWNSNRSVLENLDVSAAILSRFDLCFVLEDKAQDKHDEMLANHIMGKGSEVLHERKRHKTNQYDFNEMRATAASSGGLESASEVARRIKKMTKGVAAIPTDILKDYIRYAREFSRPKLTQSAAEKLKTYYLNMKNTTVNSGAIPITTRQLESMVRLCQARAKACLRPYVTDDDVQDVIDIMTLSIFHTLITSTGDLQTERGGVGGSSKNKQKRKLVEILKRYTDGGKGTFTIGDANHWVGGGALDGADVKEMIIELTDMGSILKMPEKTYDNKNVYKMPF